MTTPQKDELERYLETHYIHKSNWLRAAVLGANDGILSTASSHWGCRSK
jgi:VIT1/CCC1 family predicted Fe2+/Mn2+ transporter